MAEVGFEMLIYSFGSGFDIESDNETYIKEIREMVTYAHRLVFELHLNDWSQKYITANFIGLETEHQKMACEFRAPIGQGSIPCTVDSTPPKKKPKFTQLPLDFSFQKVYEFGCMLKVHK